MRIEAPNLQEAFQKAASSLGCSVTELDIKVIQHPSSGFLGFFKKNAIIEAQIEGRKSNRQNNEKKQENKKENRYEKREQNLDKRYSENRDKSLDKSEKKDENLSEKTHKKSKDDKKRNRNKKNKHQDQANLKESLSERSNTLAKDAFANTGDITQDDIKPEYVIKRLDEQEMKVKKHEQKDILDTSIIDNFNIDDNLELVQKDEKKPKSIINFDEVLPTIKDDLTRLLKASCFEINKIDVSKFNDDCVFIKLDGDDAALLIGKEGYRYKAISYLLHNWLSLKYNLSIRLEIAEFLKNQEMMIEQYLVSIVERVENTGKAQTKPLDGVLVKIALEKLRMKFPEKYVGIKSNGNDKFVVVNDFFKK